MGCYKILLFYATSFLPEQILRKLSNDTILEE